jgi:hypothetical protein
MLVFGLTELFPSHDTGGGDGSTLLSGIVLPLKGHKWGQYDGELPFQLDRANSRDQLQARFGKPIESDEDFYWEKWKVDNRILHVTFTDDYQTLTAVSIWLPDEIE